MTVGLLLMATVLLPSTKGLLSPEARGYARMASWAALSWAGTTALTMLFTLSDLLAVPATGLSGTVIVSFVTTVPQGTMLPLVLILAGCVAGYARGVVSAHGAAGLLAVALLTLLPPVLTGHSASCSPPRTGCPSWPRRPPWSSWEGSAGFTATTHWQP